MKIPISLIDPNPFQTRKGYDDEIRAGIAVSAMGRHGLLQAPMIRPYGERYQIAFGHGRIEAWKTLGKKDVECRVEELTDEEMKKYVLQENVLHAPLNEEERMMALDQYKKELTEKLGGREPTYIELSNATLVPESTIKKAYFVKDTRILLKNGMLPFEPTAELILFTAGLPNEERIKLIIKTFGMGWSSDTAFKVKTAIKDMDSKVRLKILDKDTDLTHKTIVALVEIKDPETQKEIIKRIEIYGLNEKDALKLIEKTLAGNPPQETTVVNESEAIFNEFTSTLHRIDSWGYNHYQILGRDGWQRACVLFDKIEEKIRWLKREAFLNKEIKVSTEE